MHLFKKGLRFVTFTILLMGSLMLHDDTFASDQLAQKTTGKILFMANGRIMATNFQGDYLTQLTDEKIDAYAFSPDLSKVIYAIHGRKIIDYIDIALFSSPKELANYTDTSTILGYYYQPFEWSLDSKRVVWDIYDHDSYPPSMLQYLDAVSQKIESVTHPFDKTFYRFRSLVGGEYAISPNGKYIAFIHNEHGNKISSVAIYRIEDRVTENLSDGSFSTVDFDVSNKLYASSACVLWMEYNPVDGKRIVSTSQSPDCSNKLDHNFIRKNFLFNTNKTIYGCDKQNFGICISNNDGTNEEELFNLRQVANVANVYQSFPPYNSYYSDLGFFLGLKNGTSFFITDNKRPDVYNVNKSEDKEYLWAVSLSDKSLKKITEWEIKPEPDDHFKVDYNKKEALRPISKKDHIRGSAKAPVTLLMYSDLQDTSDQKYYHIFYKLLKTYPKALKWVYRQRPRVSQNPYTIEAAESSECAGEQNKFWEYLDKTFSIKKEDVPIDEMQALTLAKSVKLNIKKFKTCLQSDKYRAFIKAEIKNANGNDNGISWRLPSAILITPEGREIEVDQKNTYDFIVANLK